jgi:nucleoside-triphosphatase THEP1
VILTAEVKDRCRQYCALVGGRQRAENDPMPPVMLHDRWYKAEAQDRVDRIFPAKVGVVAFDPPSDPGPVLSGLVAHFRARGVTVGGLLQRRGAEGRRSMWVDDIATGRTLRLDRQRGKDARSCVLDTEALAEAAALLRATIESAPDVIVINRFAKAELEGQGLRAEFAEAVLSPALVLTAARREHLHGLAAFLGEAPEVLPLSVDAIATWVEALLAVPVPEA